MELSKIKTVDGCLEYLSDEHGYTPIQIKRILERAGQSRFPYKWLSAHILKLEIDCYYERLGERKKVKRFRP